MQQAARRALSTSAPLNTIAQTEAYTVFGGADGGFAIVAQSERLPAVIGRSAKPYSPENEGLQWYLRAVSALSAATQRTATKPATLELPEQVAPMMTTLWQQEHPYNMLCPTAASGHCLTGCVATAMAQILAYHGGPHHGRGVRTIYYPANNTSGQPVTARFEDNYYDWPLMTDDPTLPSTGQAQQLAVATLMRDCGVAANMQYGPASSGATLADAADGLTRYFGLAGVHHEVRSANSEADWMRMVYTELSQGRPILYGGMDPNPMAGISGHAFVLHGYDADGLVYVNWGWGGLSDGYYDIALLNPQNLSFSTVQDMVVGIAPEPFVAVKQTINDVQPGTLATLTAADLTDLTLTGTLDAADLAHLRQLAAQDGTLEQLDLSGARLPDDALPAGALADAAALRRLVMPATLRSWAEGALAGCRQLRDVVMPEPTAERDFIVEGPLILSADRTELLAVLPSASGIIALPRGLQSIHDEALRGCVRIEQLTIPSTVATIGSRAMSQLRDLSELRLTLRQLPQTAPDALQDVDFEHCRLYVLRGHKQLFADAEPWRQFQSDVADNILEWGTTIKARNAMREQGQPNPEFGYQIVGDYVEGTPELTCDATPASAPGRYPIHVLPGTIVSEAVDYEDGYLIVVPAADAIHAATTTEATPAPTFAPDGRQARQRHGLRVAKGRKWFE